MRNYHLYGAGSVFSQLIDSAPTREPQRVTWHGKEAVVVASKADWLARPKRSPILSRLFLKTMAETELADAIGHRSWVTGKRIFGRDFADRTPMFLCDAGIVSLFDT
jgi:prevent-host-death family protein